MSESCIWTPCVKNKKGEIVDSILWKELSEQLKERDKVKLAYSIGTDETFINKYKDYLDFDRNGEVTVASLSEVIDVGITPTSILAVLNKQIGAGSYSFQEAVERMSVFNRESNYRSKYLATVSVGENGKYDLSVVKNTPEAKINLSDTIRNFNFQQQLITKLAEHGVSVEFLKDEVSYNGRYSTANVEKTAEGLYTLIQVADNLGIKLDATLAEEAGHFVIGAMSNTSLVQRLISLLTPEVRAKILERDGNLDKALGNNPAKEMAGYLVGKALRKEQSSNSFINTIVGRVIDAARSLFSKITHNEIIEARREAEKIARQLANDFWTTPGGATAEEALQIKETFYDRANTPVYNTYSKALNAVSTMLSNLKKLGADKDIIKEWEKSLNTIVNQAALSSLFNNGLIEDKRALECVINVLQQFLQKFQRGGEIEALLDNVQVDSNRQFQDNTKEYATALRTVQQHIQTLTYMTKMLGNLLYSSSMNSYRDSSGKVVLNTQGQGLSYVQVNLNDLQEQLVSLCAVLSNTWHIKNRAFVVRFLEEVHGSKTIALTSKLGWTKKMDAREVTIEQIVDAIQDRGTWLSRITRTMSNSPDIALTLIDKIVKRTQHDEVQSVNRDQDTIRVLMERLHKLPIQESDLFEKEGKDFTGNFISALHYGRWEAEYSQFLQQEREAWIKDCEQKGFDLSQQSDVIRGILWHDYFHQKVKNWHSTHSIYDKALGRYIPNFFLYRNSDFDKLISKSPEVAKFYDDFMKFYLEMKQALPNGSIGYMRAPQFNGSFINKIKNRQGISIFKKITQATIAGIRETFCESANDTDFGGDHIMTEQDDLFQTWEQKDDSKIQSLAYFGINRLKDMRNLSTDLQYSLMAFSTMVNHQKSFEAIMNTLEDTAAQLTSRGYRDSQIEDAMGHLKARLTQYLHKQVYNIATNKVSYGGIVLNKVLNQMKSSASAFFLWGNVKGGITNTGTGVLEILKEAAAGEFFTLKDLAVAEELYAQSQAAIWGQNLSMSNMHTDKLSLFIRHFDIRDMQVSKARNWKGHKRDRFGEAFSNTMYIPYSSGDHWMQVIPYLALANKIHLYGEDGREVTLYEAYEKMKVGNSNITTLGLSQLYYKTPNGKNDYHKADTIRQKILNKMTLTSDEQIILDALLDKIGELGTTDTEVMVGALNDYMTSLLWTGDDEAAYSSKAREIDIRLHGVYNSKDQVLLQSHILGSLFASMKGYVFGMMERRLSGAHWNELLGEEVEGSYISSLKYLWTLIGSTMGLDTGNSARNWKNWVGLVLPILPVAKAQMAKSGFSRNQIANMTRTWLDIVTTTLLALTFSALTSAPDDDDEGQMLAAYLVYRLYLEQAAFNTRFTDTFSGVITDFSMPIISVVRLLQDFIELMYPDDSKSKRKRRGTKTNAEKRIEWIEKHTPYYKDLRVIEDPESALGGQQYYEKTNKR